VLPDEIMKMPCGTLSYVAPEVQTVLYRFTVLFPASTVLLVLPDEIMEMPCGTLSYVAPEVQTVLYREYITVLLRTHYVLLGLPDVCH
jgi:hypothetical protein